MAAGKIQHWKHGWIPLDDFARRLVGKKTKAEERAAAEAKYQAGNREYNAWRASVGRPVDPDLIAMQEWANDHQARVSPHLLPDEARRARYAAHLKATAEKRAATEKRYQEHLRATAAKRAATHERYLAAQNLKRRG